VRAQQNVELSSVILIATIFITHIQNKYECTVDQELADAAAYAPGRRCACVCTHREQQFLREMTSWPPS